MNGIRICILSKLDQKGNKEWDQVYGGDRNESASTVRELDDGSFIISGGTGTYGSNADGDIYLLRINSQGKITDNEQEKYGLPKEYKISQNYPNPFNPRISLVTQKFTGNIDLIFIISWDRRLVT